MTMNKDGFCLSVVLICSLIVSGFSTPAAGEGHPIPKGQEVAGQVDQFVLFENSDFEAGDLTNWTVDGNAFDFQPTMGDNPTARRRRQAFRHQGEYWIGTYEKFQGKTGQRPGQSQGDRPTGTLTSIPFEVFGDQISFSSVTPRASDGATSTLTTSASTGEGKSSDL